MKNNLYKAFTLVELIVVITILAVLATVAFISFQGYTSSSRDSVRLADLKNISKSFEINRTKDIDFPLPDKKIDISASGTIFQYQWELSQNILESDLNIFDGGLDPVTKKPYGYAVNFAKNKFQIIWFLENQESVANISLNTTFADNSDKYVKSSGDELWIILDQTTNEVIIQSGSLTQIDIQNTSENYWIITHNEIIFWDKNVLYSQVEHRLKPDISCKSILYNGRSTWNGIYTINPSWISGEDFEVYCDMKTDGWGWTIIAMSYANADWDISEPFNVDLNTVANQWVGNINNLDDNYFIAMEQYSRLADIDSQKEYIWMARPAFENDPWQETLRYNQHSISSQENWYRWYGTKVSWASVNYPNKPLSTIDNDVDDSTVSHCASSYKSFGWYTDCHSAHFWSTTAEKSACWTNEWRDYGGKYYCEVANSNGPDAAGAYNTWHSLKIMIR